MQPKLFERPSETIPIRDVILYALGEFQSRGHILADRELALDRLHGSFARASEKFTVDDLRDDVVVGQLKDLGAAVVEIPAYFAKRPYRIIVPRGLAAEAINTCQQLKSKLS